MQNQLPSTLKDSKLAFEGVRFDVRTKEIVGHSGKKVRRDAVIFPGAVSILPIVDKDHIVMIKNYRFCVGETLWELPAGTLEPGEPPLETAKRELIEETGFEAAEMTPLFEFYPSPGICTERMYVFVAKNLTKVGQKLDESEEITVEILDWKTIFSMIHSNEIRDGKTIATLLYFQQFAMLKSEG